MYFKVGDTNRRKYEQAGSTPFEPYVGRGVSMSYYSVPTEVLESPISLGQWAARSIEVARATRLLMGRRRSSAAPKKK